MTNRREMTGCIRIMPCETSMRLPITSTCNCMHAWYDLSFLGTKFTARHCVTLFCICVSVIRHVKARGHAFTMHLKLVFPAFNPQSTFYSTSLSCPMHRSGVSESVRSGLCRARVDQKSQTWVQVRDSGLSRLGLGSGSKLGYVMSSHIIKHSYYTCIEWYMAYLSRNYHELDESYVSIYYRRIRRKLCRASTLDFIFALGYLFILIL